MRPSTTVRCRSPGSGIGTISMPSGAWTVRGSCARPGSVTTDPAERGRALGSRSVFGGDSEPHPDLERIRVGADHILIRVEDQLPLRAVAIDLLGDHRERVAFFHHVNLFLAVSIAVRRRRLSGSGGG